jgi:hypothetical protein
MLGFDNVLIVDLARRRRNGLKIRDWSGIKDRLI